MSSEAVNKLAPPEEVFYRRLMSVVDDFGRFDGRPQVLRGRLYPLRIDSVREADITRWIAACVKAGLIALYHVDGKPYLLLGKLGPPRATNSKFPAPPPEIDRGLLADASTCAQMKSDEIICAHVKANVPYSNSGSDTDSNTGTDTGAKGGGEDLFNPEPLFDAFWKDYPRKVAKPEARKAFLKAVIDDAAARAVCEGLARWKRSRDWTKDDGAYIPHPATFLNQRRWEDDPEPEKLKATSLRDTDSEYGPPAWQFEKSPQQGATKS